MTREFGIAVGVDASWAKAGAVDWALLEAKLSARPMKVFHVVEGKPPTTPHFAAPGEDQAGRRLGGSVSDYLSQQGGSLTYTVDVLAGHSARTLARAAEDSRMLVVGRHGQGLLGRMLLGSTAEAVAHEAHIPVVVVPDKWQPAEPSAPILVGVDESEQCHTAIEFAIGLAAERGAPVQLVHVWDVPSIYTWDATPESGTIAEWSQYNEQRLENTAQLWRDKYPDVRIETEIRRDHPVFGLAEAMQEAAGQLLVLGGRNHNRLVSLLLGSTARGVLHHASYPLAIVHEPRARHRSDQAHDPA
jgi:nucleotide-binding universal stress UspA family protein